MILPPNAPQLPPLPAPAPVNGMKEWTSGGVRYRSLSTMDMVTESMRPGQPALFDLDDSGTANYRFVMPCEGMVAASVQVEPTAVVAGTAFVLTVIVSNDPKQRIFVAHPSVITLTNTNQITPVFAVAGYLHFGVMLTTVNGGNAYAHLYLVCKDRMY